MYNFGRRAMYTITQCHLLQHLKALKQNNRRHITSAATDHNSIGTTQFSWWFYYSDGDKLFRKI